MANLVIIQVLLTLVIGLWIAAKFRDSPIIKFFGRNDWFVGAFLILVGYMNYVNYVLDYMRNINLILGLIGFIFIMISMIDFFKK